jgi:hypothetical protein
MRLLDFADSLLVGKNHQPEPMVGSQAHKTAANPNGIGIAKP